MAYRVAPEARVVAALARVFEARVAIESQAELARLVRAQLAADDPTLRVSEPRIRQLALESGLARLDVRTRRTVRPLPSACPVCGDKLRRRRNRTLQGGETVVGARCVSCPYTTGPRLDEPTLYVFHARRGRRNGRPFPTRGRTFR